MSLWPDSLQLGEPTRCFLSWIFCALVQVVVACCCLLCVVYKYCWAIWMFFPNVPHAITKNSQKITSVGSSMLSNTWCWAFVVTLRAAEWITSSVGSFMCLQMAWCWTFFVTGSSWMVHHQCGFFRVSLNGLILNSCSHTGSNWMIYHCCGSFQVSSKCLMLNIFCHSESSWMVYHQCGLFHVSSNGLILNIWSATRSKWMFFHWCELFHVSSNCLMLRNGSNWMVYHLCGFFLVQVQNQFMCFVFHVENWTDIQV